MLNVERLKTLREFLVKHEDRFAYSVMLSDWDHCRYGDITQNDCGTLACVGGWALALFHPDLPLSHVFRWKEANRVLGLTDMQGYFLFWGEDMFGFPKIDLETATLRNALDRIDYLIKEAEPC